MLTPDEYLRGRGAQTKPANRFEAQYIDKEVVDGVDDFEQPSPRTRVFLETPKTILSKNNSPDLAWRYSINPYQGCEHGCTYCYARNSHEYWGFNAGLDFETKIIIKKNAHLLLEKEFLKKSWKPSTVMLSGNTDCYQPLEKQYRLTRKVLGVFAKYRNPVGIITKNALVCRDMDLLKELAKDNLVSVAVSLNSLNEDLRRVLEPRTSSSLKRLNAIAKLSDAGVPAMVMVAPIIPGLNHHEIPKIIEQAALAGASTAGYTTVRLNGQIAGIFKDWLDKNFPDRADKVWHQIQWLHGGKVNDTDWGRRMKGAGVLAESIERLFRIAVKKHMPVSGLPPMDTSRFRRGGNYTLF